MAMMAMTHKSSVRLMPASLFPGFFRSSSLAGHIIPFMTDTMRKTRESFEIFYGGTPRPALPGIWVMPAGGSAFKP